jgi:hypothetical protein
MQDLYPSENGGGPEALDRLHAALRADAGADAQAFAALAVRLRAAGVTEMRLVTVAGEGS